MEYINQVINGDCEEVLKECPDGLINLIFCSPPYADIKNKYKNGYTGMSPERYNDWIIPKIKQFCRVLDNRGSFILNIDSKVVNGFRSTYVLELVCRIVNETGFKLYEELTWNKGKSLCHPKRFRNPLEKVYWFVKQRNFTLNLDDMRVEYDKKSIQRMKRPIKKRHARTESNQNENKYKNWSQNPLGALPSTLIKIGSQSKRICDFHVASFPIKLAEYFILGASNEKDIVLDPFLGTGQTLVAAKNLNRNYLGIDISEEYCDFSKNRLSKVSSLALVSCDTTDNNAQSHL